MAAVLVLATTIPGQEAAPAKERNLLVALEESSRALEMSRRAIDSNRKSIVTNTSQIERVVNQMAMVPSVAAIAGAVLGFLVVLGFSAKARHRMENRLLDPHLAAAAGRDRERHIALARAAERDVFAPHRWVLFAHLVGLVGLIAMTAAEALPALPAGIGIGCVVVSVFALTTLRSRDMEAVAAAWSTIEEPSFVAMHRPGLLWWWFPILTARKADRLAALAFLVLPLSGCGQIEEFRGEMQGLREGMTELNATMNTHFGSEEGMVAQLGALNLNVAALRGKMGELDGPEGSLVRLQQRLAPLEKNGGTLERLETKVGALEAAVTRINGAMIGSGGAPGLTDLMNELRSAMQGPDGLVARVKALQAATGSLGASLDGPQGLKPKLESMTVGLSSVQTGLDTINRTVGNSDDGLVKTMMALEATMKQIMQTMATLQSAIAGTAGTLGAPKR